MSGNPELVFLDVEMPHGSGFDLLTQFPEKSFDVIFITAFNHYAVKAIKVQRSGLYPQADQHQRICRSS
ncbi:MAG: hypothetical protein MZV70_67100 [Desulfobacterales bacterium]|nr:hypothetical protein [Desulfobacterales bacterium]